MRLVVSAMHFTRIYGHLFDHQSAFQKQLVQQVSAMIFVVQRLSIRSDQVVDFLEHLLLRVFSSLALLVVVENQTVFLSYRLTSSKMAWKYE